MALSFFFFFALVGVPEQALGGFPWVWIDFRGYLIYTDWEGMENSANQVF